jgi:hypothetical protein
MTTLVLGASGATGRLLVEQLLKRGQKVRIIIRSPYKLPEFFQNNDLFAHPDWSKIVIRIDPMPMIFPEMKTLIKSIIQSAPIDARKRPGGHVTLFAYGGDAE